MTKQPSSGTALLAPHGDGSRKGGLNKACLTPICLASYGQQASLPSNKKSKRKKTADLKVACWSVHTIRLWSSAVRVHDSQACRKMDVTRERIRRILELKTNTPVIPHWFQSCQCCCCLCYSREYLWFGTLTSYNGAQILEACDVTVSSFCPLSYFNLCVDGIVCHQLCLVITDLHAVGCGGFVEMLANFPSCSSSSPAKTLMSSAKWRLVNVLLPMLMVPL